MSATFTLPMAAGDQFNHGHEHKHSHSRSHQRNSRLAPPFSLPRIPSGVATDSHPDDHDPYVDRHDHEHENDHSSRQQNYLIPSPQFDPSRPLVTRKRSFETRTSGSPTQSTFQPPSDAAAMSYAHGHRQVSAPTSMLLHATENYSLLHGILADNDSRRIFYFMILNLAFMGVQSTYGFLTGSLGLISDSIHMFFDCVALFVGVCAAVMSKWPPSTKFPYGYGKIDTLAGLGNGIFLMLISVEIIYEAIERLFMEAEISRTNELLLVSLAGFAVNMIGIFAFHGHHGHSHGHDHGHSHSHGHDHKHSHDLPQSQSHSHSKSHSHDHHEHLRRPSIAASASPTKTSKESPIAQSHGHSHHGHSHGGENMQGIYLHIMADALGSVAVVVSTLLVQLTGWSGFDPLASCIIAVLIFASTVPLVSSTTQSLLLSLNSDCEYNLRDILAGITSIRGVVGYAAPKFWLESVKPVDAHGHDHCHSHGNQQTKSASKHKHKKSDGNQTDFDHAHSHCHEHDHSHSHTHSHSSSHDHYAQSDSYDEDDITTLGVIHVIVSQLADMEDVKARVDQYFFARKMDLIVQYEREGEGKCWCGGSTNSNTNNNGSINGIGSGLKRN